MHFMHSLFIKCLFRDSSVWTDITKKTSRSSTPSPTVFLNIIHVMRPRGIKNCSQRRPRSETRLHSIPATLVSSTDPDGLVTLGEDSSAVIIKELDSKLNLRSSNPTCSTNTGAFLLEKSATLPDVHLPSLDMKVFTSPHSSTASNKHRGYVTK